MSILASAARSVSILLAAALASSGAGAAALTTAQARRVAAHVQAAQRLAAGEPVRAFLHLREAQRLEQLWSGNTLGDDTRTAAAMERFTRRLVRGSDDRLLKILHAHDVPLPDKLGLIRLLEEDVILRHPGAGSDTLLQSYDE